MFSQCAIKEVYDLCYNNDPSFRSFGTELTYLTHAVLSNLRCELNPLSALVLLLKDKLPITHLAWEHIRLEPTVLCINCESEILWDQASFCPPLDGWLGHNCCVDADEDESYDEYEVLFT